MFAFAMAAEVSFFQSSAIQEDAVSSNNMSHNMRKVQKLEALHLIDALSLQAPKDLPEPSSPCRQLGCRRYASNNAHYRVRIAV